MLFVVKVRASKPLTKDFVALINKVEWHEADNSATIYFEPSESGKPQAKPITVKLNVDA